MNVLFLSLAPIASLEDRGIYPDLLRIFVKNGHFVRIISVQPDRATYDDRREGYAVLHVQTPQMQKVGLLKKGIASLQIGPNIRRALDRHCRNERYDLILMATPPITLAGVVAYIKKRDGAKFYLLLKDIWPQGIADLGAISQSGPVYRYFRAKEKKLYALADQIGCMSPANVKYVLRHNPALEPQQVEVCPNSEEPDFWTMSPEEASAIRAKYGIPQGRKIFLYGGNLGRPQDIPFVIECLRAAVHVPDAFFVICGSGTEYGKLRTFVEAEKYSNLLLLSGLPRADYDKLVRSCHVGLLFLDHRFTIPNFPSRLLSYLQAGLPVIACTDPATDIGDIAQAGGFGWKCPSDDPAAFVRTVERACSADLASMGDAGRMYFSAHYTAEQSYEIIMRGLER